MRRVANLFFCGQVRALPWLSPGLPPLLPSGSATNGCSDPSEAVSACDGIVAVYGSWSETPGSMRRLPLIELLRPISSPLL